MGKKYIEIKGYEKWAGEDLSKMYQQGGAVYLENGPGLPPERVVPFELEIKGGRVDFEFDEAMEFARAEREGMKNMFELAKDGYDVIFWFSPPGGEYKEGRVVVARPVEKEGDDIRLECRGLVVLKSRQEMMDDFECILRKGGVTMDGVSEIEDMRSQPVGVILGKGGDWVSFGQEVLGMEEVWQVIRRGEDVRNKETISRHFGQVWQEVKRRGGDERMLELLMMDLGYRLNAMGNHGGSSLVTGGMRSGLGLGIFSPLFESVEIGYRAERRADGKIVCPCGEVLREGASRCPKCGLKLVAGSLN